MSRTPAITDGWLATIPTEYPSRRPNPTTALGAKAGWISRKLSRSRMTSRISRTSYASPSSCGMSVLSSLSIRFAGSYGVTCGGSSLLFWGR